MKKQKKWTMVVLVIGLLVLGLIGVAATMMFSNPYTASMLPEVKEEYIILTPEQPQQSQKILVAAQTETLELGMVLDPGVKVQLFNPDAVPLDPGKPAALNATYHSTTEADGTTGVRLAVTHPAAGAWSLVFTTAAPQPGGSRAVIERLMTGENLPTSSLLVDYGQVSGIPVQISVAAFAGTQPIQGADVTLKITNWGTQEQKEIQAVDSGDLEVGDLQNGDGLYSIQVEDLGSAFYLAEATVTATLEGLDVELKSSNFFAVYPQTATFKGDPEDHAVDHDGDGLMDEIVLSFPVEKVHRSGNYVVNAELVASNGKVIKVGEGSNELTPTSTRIQTTYSAADLREKLGADGPYTIRNVQFQWEPMEYPTDPEAHIIQRIAEVGKTQAYQLKDFDRPYIQFSKHLGDRGIDTNGNKQFDQIEVSFLLDSVLDLDVGYKASLVPASGLSEEGGASMARNNIHLQKGLNTLTLRFNVNEYGVNRISGRFEIINLTMDPPSGWPAPYNEQPADRLTVFPSSFGPTQKYSAFQLEGGLPGDLPSLMEDVKGMTVVKPGNVNKAKRARVLNTLQRVHADQQAGRLDQVRQELNAFLNQVSAQEGKAFLSSDCEVIRAAIQNILNQL